MTRVLDRLERVQPGQVIGAPPIQPRGEVPVQPEVSSVQQPQQEESAVVTPVMAPAVPRVREDDLLDRFMKLQPSRFSKGVGDDPYDFFLEVEHRFDAWSITDDANKVRITAFLLSGRAARWWRSLKV